MDVNIFLENFVDLFDDTDASAITLETNFRDLDEWSSLLALSTMSMIDDEFDVQLSAEQMRKANTIKELYDLIQSKI